MIPGVPERGGGTGGMERSSHADWEKTLDPLVNVTERSTP